MKNKNQNQGFETTIALARLSKSKSFRYDYTTSADLEIKRNRKNAIFLTSLLAVLLLFVVVLPAYENHGITWQFPWVHFLPVNFDGSFSAPTTKYYVSSEFGMRRHPIFHYNAMHNGIDLAAMRGTPVLASGEGRVTFSGWKPGYGKIIVLDHGKNLTTVYAHMSELMVDVGDKAFENHQIGAVGSTGTSTGNHLHFEIRRDGKPVNPRNYLSFNETLANPKEFTLFN